jgi:hypothetical protein
MIRTSAQDSILLYTAALNVTNQNRWGAFGRFIEPVFSKVRAQPLPAFQASQHSACSNPVACKVLATDRRCLPSCRYRL